MILTANSEVARRTRRKTGNGWHTTFIGENRNTLREGQTPPADGLLYPMAFLVEKEPHAVVKPHFHQADQYQVVVQGGGRLGTHDVGTVAVHYTDAWSAYGPIVAADDGIAWFTLRNTWDPGARYMPAAREQLRAARVRNFQHREAASPPMPVASPAGRNSTASFPVLAEAPDGMMTWRHQLPARRFARARSIIGRRPILDRPGRRRISSRFGNAAAEFLHLCRAAGPRPGTDGRPRGRRYTVSAIPASRTALSTHQRNDARVRRW